MSPSLSDRISTWKALGEVSRREETPEIAAGRRGEEFLRDFAHRNLHHGDGHVFLNKRIPKQNKGRTEVDLLVVTPRRIHVIEAKNWSGQLVDRKGKWVQIRRGGREVSHPNLVEYNDKKMKYLIDYLQQKDLPVDKSHFSQKVILINPRLEIEPSIVDHPDVITSDKLNQFFASHEKRSTSEKWLCSVIEFCFQSDKASQIVQDLYGTLTENRYRDLLDAIDGLSTWDTVYFHGEETVNGDLIRLEIGGKKIYRDKLVAHPQLNFHWQRSRWKGFFSALFGRPLGTLHTDSESPLVLSREDRAFFQPAGVAEPKYLNLTHLDEIILGVGGEGNYGPKGTRWWLILLVILAVGALVAYWYGSQISLR